MENIQSVCVKFLANGDLCDECCRMVTLRSILLTQFPRMEGGCI
jgi:hypothetical protein